MAFQSFKLVYSIISIRSWPGCSGINMAYPWTVCHKTEAHQLFLKARDMRVPYAWQCRQMATHCNNHLQIMYPLKFESMSGRALVLYNYDNKLAHFIDGNVKFTDTWGISCAFSCKILCAHSIILDLDFGGFDVHIFCIWQIVLSMHS